MITGCYTLHLYCRHRWPDGCRYDGRHGEAVDAEFTGRTFAACKREAVRRGWRFHRDGEVTCPTCIKHGPGIEPIERATDPSQGGLAVLARLATKESG